ncbi:MAG: ATP-binding protein [Alphaproteobacteria bacterium]|nr:ATP-binding protein [Alphaproteobacteria bacterium]
MTHQKVKNYFMTTGDVVRIIDGKPDVSSSLTAAHYELRQNVAGFYLKRAKPFGVPAKIFGDSDKHVKRILNTWNDRDSGLGVLLSGFKGGGKTLLAKKIANECVQTGIPSIMINDSFSAGGIAEFLGAIPGRTVVIFDEFEKIYGRSSGDQDGMLTMFDGVKNPGNKLFLLTCNETSNVSSLLLNRPGRMFYHIKYKELEAEEIEAYCDENLKDKKYTKNIISLALVIRGFSYDILSKLIEEMNRYNESPWQSLGYLNIEIYNSSSYFIGNFFDKNEKEYVCYNTDGERAANDLYFNPLTDEISVYCNFGGKKKSEIEFRPIDFECIEGDKIIMKNKSGRLELTKPIRDLTAVELLGGKRIK